MKTLRRFSRTLFFSHARITAAVILIAAAAAMAFVATSPPASAQPTARTHPLTPKFSNAVAFDISPAVRNLPVAKKPLAAPPLLREIRPELERGPRVQPKGRSGDNALQSAAWLSPLAIPTTSANFEGVSNQDNFNIFGFRVNPPDPVGDIGPNHYVEMVKDNKAGSAANKS